MASRFHLLCIAFSAAVWPAGAGQDILLYERCEGRAEGAPQGVRFLPGVIGFGGIGVDNRHSAQFDGQPASCINHGPSLQVRSTEFTVEAFLKLDRARSYGAIASDWSEAGNQRSWAFMVTPDRGLRFDVSPDGAFQAANKLGTPPRLLRRGVWYHVAAVSEDEVSRIYVNGHLVAEKRRAQPGIFTGDRANLKIGNVDGYADNTPKPFFGQLDEVRITARALGPDEFIQTVEPMPEAAGPTPEVYDLPFTARTGVEASAWQKEARARLLELVGSQEPRRSELPLDVQVGPATERDNYTLLPISFQGNNPGQRYPARLCLPEGQGPFPAMLCLHGHSGSAEAVFDPEDCYHGFADRFARGGYVVLAPSFPHRPYAALTLWNLFRCVDMLVARPEVDADRIGVAGLSMGGEWSMWLAACDTRVRVAVISGWMCTTEGVFSVPNCSCWELPGFVELMDVSEVNLLIAPRPVVFESAERDGCFPVAFTRQGFETIRTGYKLFGAEDAVVHDVFPGVHEWHGKAAFPMVDRVLGGDAGGGK